MAGVSPLPPGLGDTQGFEESWLGTGRGRWPGSALPPGRLQKTPLSLLRVPAGPALPDPCVLSPGGGRAADPELLGVADTQRQWVTLHFLRKVVTR